MKSCSGAIATETGNVFIFKRAKPRASRFARLLGFAGGAKLECKHASLAYALAQKRTGTPAVFNQPASSPWFSNF